MNIRNLILSGGGVKGYSYIGVIKAFEEYDILKNIKTIVGTSIGSIFATLVSINYSYKELNELCLNIDLGKINNISTENIINFLNSKGIDDGDKVERIINILIKAKTNNGVQTTLIEVKPFKQTQEPKIPKRKTRRFLNEVTTYLVNEAKWKAAQEFCKDRKWKFQIITENELGRK